MATDTRAQYAAFAAREPGKARKYQARIVSDLAGSAIHDIERERLTEALAGIADGLRASGACSECGRAAEHLIDGKGSTCARKAS